MSDYSSHFWLIYLAAGLLGLLIGSFLNVVILRLPKIMEDSWRTQCCEFLEIADTDPEKKKVGLVFPASHCPKCLAPIRAWQNIPVVSYLFLKGQCANCKVNISMRYPIIELTTALLSAFVIYQFGPTYTGASVLVLTWCLIVLTVIDIDTQLLPDSITLPLIWAGLILSHLGFLTSLPEALWGAVFGYLSLWSVYWVFKIVTGKEGMGHGDFKLLAALGAWLGWQMLPLVIMLSTVVGSVLGISYIIVKGRDKNIPIPFGPYLAIAGWIALIWGEPLMQTYLQFVNIG